MLFTLDDINTKELSEYKQELSTQTGNVLMQLTYLPNPLRHDQCTMREIIISFKSLVLQQWSKGWPGQYSEYDFLNFYLSHIETVYCRNKCNQQRFITGFWECNHQKGQVTMCDQYSFKNLQEHNYPSNITLNVDEIILVVVMQGMLFCYIYCISRHACHLLDVQHNAASRYGEHQQIITEVLKTQYNISRPQEINLIQLAEIKYNKIQNQLIRASFILDLINKYIKNTENVHQIERIKINVKDANSLIDKIVWFVYKSYKQQPPHRPKKLQSNLDNPHEINVTFNSWANEQDHHKLNQNYQNMIVQSQVIKGQLKGKLDYQPLQNGQFLGQQHRSESSSFFGKIANSQIISQLSLEKSQIKPYELNKSVRLNKIKQDVNSIPQQIDKSTIQAEQFIQEAGFREAPSHPQQRQLAQYQSYEGEGIIRMDKSELMTLLESNKKDIKQELEVEFQKRLEEKILLQQDQNKISEKDQLQSAIVEEYLNQIKFQKYQDYMQYLLSYYYNYDTQKYKQLLEEYHNRIQSFAINGLTELQKKEMVRLVSMTKEKVLQQNQQLDLALFNQKRVLNQMNQQKNDYKKQMIQQKLLSEQQQQTKHVYQFSKLQEVNPFLFKEEDLMGNFQTDNNTGDRYDLINIYPKDEAVEQIYSSWDFQSLEKKERDKDLIKADVDLSKVNQPYSKNPTITKVEEEKQSSFNDLSFFSNEDIPVQGSNPQKSSSTKKYSVQESQNISNQQNLNDRGRRAAQENIFILNQNELSVPQTQKL